MRPTRKIAQPTEWGTAVHGFLIRIADNEFVGVSEPYILAVTVHRGFGWDSRSSRQG